MSVGQMSVGQMSVGQMSVGQMNVGQMSVEKIILGHMKCCRTNDVFLSLGQMIR